MASKSHWQSHCAKLLSPKSSCGKNPHMRKSPQNSWGFSKPHEVLDFSHVNFTKPHEDLDKGMSFLGETSWGIGKPHTKTSLSSSWGPHEDLMRTSWGPHEDLMRTSWGPHEDLMRTSWGPHEVLMRSPWGPHEVPMRSSWGPHEVLMGSSWGPHEVLMRTSVRFKTSLWGLVNPHKNQNYLIKLFLAQIKEF